MPIILDVLPLNDDVLNSDAEIVGSMESYFYATWDRVDEAIKPLPHVGVRYRWTTDSTDELALFIEIPVQGDPGVSEMIDARDRVRQALVELNGDRPAYIHFVDSDTPQGVDA